MENIKRDNQSIVRGASALFILFTHLSAFTSQNCVFRAFSSFGYIWVGIFFFYSGYNLISSYMNKEEFFKKFWYKKITRIYIPFILSNILFILIQIYCNHNIFSIVDFIKYTFGIKVINEVNWYIYAIMFFYFSSWLVLLLVSRFNKIKKNKIVILVASILIFIIYGRIYYNIAWNLHLTTSIRNVYPLTMLIGMLYSLYKNEISKILNNKIIYEILFIVLFFASVTLHYANIKGISVSILNVKAIDYIVPIIFTIFILLISYKVEFHSKLCGFIDKISLETYTFHFTILNLYSNKMIVIKNSYTYILVYIITVIAISYAVRKLIDIIFYRKKRQKRIKEKKVD